MELWFILAVLSAFAAGVSAFTHKIIAVKNKDIQVFNVISSFVSASVLFSMVLYFHTSFNFFNLAVFMAFLGALGYLGTLVLKIESLKEIDSAIFFPLYKVAGPLVVIFFGVLFFSERFSSTETIGLVLSLLVPLLLVTKAENARQKNLKRGLFMLLIASIAGAISIAIHKYGVSIADNVLLYIFASELFSMVFSAAFLLKKYKIRAPQYVAQSLSKKWTLLVFIMGISQAAAGTMLFFAFALNGPLSIVYTVSSLYILIPIILSILFLKEHWNLQKAIAIILSILALGFLK